MKNRVKEIRKQSKETQMTFADKLNVSKSTIEAIEYGRREPTDRMIADICRVYNVNEDWLRYGTGDMFKPLDKAQEVALLSKRLLTAEDDDFFYKLIKVLADLSEEQLAVLEDIAKQLIEEEIENEKNSPS